MNENEHEILSITQEECAEIIQAISKVFRFGLDTEWNGETNREHLEEELGDVMAMIHLLELSGIVSSEGVHQSSKRKMEKLSKWSNINIDKFCENK
jgi:NTP pyrophosphatase (non-canonical NTP hydrolase)